MSGNPKSLGGNVEIKRAEKLGELLGKALKYDEEKPALALHSSVALIEIGKVLTAGAEKYDADNWRAGMAWRRLISASLRHLLAFNDGEDLDPETGLSHLAHAGCCIEFLLEYQLKKLGTDDRYKKETAK